MTIVVASPADHAPAHPPRRALSLDDLDEPNMTGTPDNIIAAGSPHPSLSLANAARLWQRKPSSVTCLNPMPHRHATCAAAPNRTRPSNTAIAAPHHALDMTMSALETRRTAVPSAVAA